MTHRSSTEERTPLILLTGATGYVGGQLLGVLADRGHRIRCLVRRPGNMPFGMSEDVEVVRGDVLERDTLIPAMEGVHTAYYLVHSMASRAGFEEADRRAARNFADAARGAGLRRIIYLGGLGESGDALSPHLRSRHEVGDILRESGVPVIEFRASIVIGAGSLSFEMIRALVERLPVMITPRWVSVRAQPICVTDLMQYLIAAMEGPFVENRIFEIGGADPVSYGDLMYEYARQRGLWRLMIPVPVLTPRLSSLWLGLVTPLNARVGRSLVDSIRHPTVVRDKGALDAFDVRPKGVGEAIAAALRNEDREWAGTRWSETLAATNARRHWAGVRVGNRIVDSRTVRVRVSPARAFQPLERIGGRTGWYYGNWLWQLRGWLDRLVGGVGMRRGRRDADRLAVDDVVDCWRVEAVDPPRRLRLVAEMRLPGRAWLDFEVDGDADSSTIRQTAVFDPLGVVGLAYWYLLYPIHHLVFAGMLRGIARGAEREDMRP